MGTGFERVLRLPLRSGEIADLFERDTQGSGIDQRKAISLHFDGRVLLVEDEEVNRVIAQKLLESHGCTVVVARDGEDALEKIEREHFDLILMDIKMPGMGGVEATRLYRAREERSRSGLHLPIVALTASVLPETREETQVAGMDGFLAKPLRREELAEVLTRWLPRARMREVS